MLLLTTVGNVSTIFVYFLAQRSSLYHNTNTEAKGNIFQKKKMQETANVIYNLSTQKASFCFC